MKLVRKIFSLLLVVCMLFSSSTALAADTSFHGLHDELQPQDNGYYTWKIKGPAVYKGIETRPSTSPYSISGKAAAGGETHQANVTLSLAVTVSGTCQVSRDAIAATVGVSLTGTISVGASQTTRSLRKGEYVEVYVSPQYQVYEVTQVHGYQLHSDFYEDGRTEVVTVYVPVTPAISFVYKR